MGTISKILGKINKAKSAINSLKGIGAKLESLNYTSQVDKLGEQAEYAQQILKDRRASLAASMDSANKRRDLAKKNPASVQEELIYPVNDLLPNYIVFTTRPRKPRINANSSGSGNLLADSSTEIMLYVPDGITSDSTVSFQSQGVSKRGKNIMRAVEGMQSATTIGQKFDKGKDVVVGVVEDQLVTMANAITDGSSNIKYGRAVNPMKEQMLDGVDFRSFDFDYEFWPKNEMEAIMVNKIIWTFRTAMLPDTFGATTDGEIENYYNYPNIFDVEFEGELAGKIDGFLPMVCTGCSVDHFNGNKVSTFANGQPVSTSMKLSFSEIKVLSQESYQQISPLGNKNIGSDRTSLINETQTATDITRSAGIKPPTQTGTGG
jgi:hypothetical protein